jgi:hypothetical protein
MRLARRRRPKWAWTFRDGGVRRLHSRNDTEYLLSNPANAKWIFDSIEQLRRWDEIMFGESDLPPRIREPNDAAA